MVQFIDHPTRPCRWEEESDRREHHPWEYADLEDEVVGKVEHDAENYRYQDRPSPQQHRTHEHIKRQPAIA